MSSSRSMLRAWLEITSAVLLILFQVRAKAGVVVSTVFSFDGTNGGGPDAPLILGPDGSFYGTTEGGTHSTPSVFNLSQSGDLKNVALLPGGFDLWGPFVLTSDGSIYGTTSFSPSTSGTIFRVSPSGAFQILFSFNGTNGDSPSGIIMGPDGALYGTTRGGGLGFNGTQGSGFGTLFRIDTNGTFSTVFMFNGTNGWGPYRMLLGRDGVFYGTTHIGGASITNGFGYGTVFKLVPGGPLTTLHCFNNTDGAAPLSLTQGSDGALYGVVQAGGSTATSPFGGYGTVYRITTDGVFRKLADCDSATQFPLSIVQATDGTLYGSAIGGTVGSIFRVGLAGTLTVVYSFDSYNLPGFLVQISGGPIYGTSREGGIYSQGTIFRLDLTPDPPLIQLSAAQNNQLTLSWNASVGRNYQVQSCADAFHQNWTNDGNAFTATNATLSISPTANPTQGGFYRVVLLP